MSSYRDIEGILRNTTNAKIMILDSNNLQFFFQHNGLLPQSYIFTHYDLVLIPGWVHAEYSHHSGKTQYVATIPVPTLIVDEVIDYLPMLSYSDKKLMEWIDQFYDQGFPTRTTGTRITRKNAGELSILTLGFSLLSHYPNQIVSISLATSDHGIIKLKEKVLGVANEYPLELNIAIAPPLSFLTTDVVLYNAVKTGIIQPHQIANIRTNPISSIYVEHFPDGSSNIHDTLVGTTNFIHMCQNHQSYTIIF